MARITLGQAAAWCGGYVAPEFAQVSFAGANIDSRKIENGQLFVALEGVRDGHDFIDAAMKKGAVAVLGKRAPAGVPLLVTEDARVALGRIAAGYRQASGMQVVGVTGSMGKSTTKEMVACVLDGDYIVSKTPANFNNDLGMPMAILAMPEDTQVAVLEMGMSHFGEIAYLSGIARPDAAVIINVGTMHMENLGSPEGVLQAKLEILEGMGPDAKAFFCGDSPMLWSARETLQRPVTWFGADNPACQVRASQICLDDGVSFRVSSEAGAFNLALALEGRHYVTDALAAVAVGLAFGVTPERIAHRLGTFRNMAGRQEIFNAKGFHIIRDCYNAGPESMAAALAVLGRRSGRRIAVLGDMLELGAVEQEAHRTVGRIASENADAVLAYGPLSRFVQEGAGEKCRTFTDREAMAEALRSLARPGDTLLFKGSHGMHMEIVLDLFLEVPFGDTIEL